MGVSDIVERRLLAAVRAVVAGAGTDEALVELAKTALEAATDPGGPGAGARLARMVGVLAEAVVARWRSSPSTLSSRLRSARIFGSSSGTSRDTGPGPPKSAPAAAPYGSHAR